MNKIFWLKLLINLIKAITFNLPSLIKKIETKIKELESNN